MDSSIPPDLIREIQLLKEEVNLLKKAPRWRSISLSTVNLQTDKGSGWQSGDTTAFQTFFLAESPLTAPVLSYSVQTSNDWEITALSSIEWRIVATTFSFSDKDTPLRSVTIATGSSNVASWTDGEETFDGDIDLTSPSFFGVEALFRLLRIELQVKRTGGTGDVAAKLMRPLFLKTPDNPPVSVPPPADVGEEVVGGGDPDPDPDPDPPPPVTVYYEGVILTDTNETWS